MQERRATSAGALVVVSGAAILFALAPPAPSRPATDMYTAVSGVGTIEVERFESIRAMVGSADLIVLAQPTRIEPGRVVGSEPEAQVQFANVFLTVLQTIRGNPPAGDLYFEVTSYPGELPQLMSEEKEQVGIYFLRDKGNAPPAWGLPADLLAREAGIYRLVSSQGLIVDAAGRAAMPASDPGSMRGQVDGRPFQDVLAQVITDR